jgi:hypothetical protein
VQRLKLYQSKLVIFPRKNSKRVKKGDSSVEQQAAVTQVTTKQTLPIEQPQERLKARKISKEESEAQVVAFCRKTRTDAKLWGKREKRASDKAKAAAADGGKAEAKKNKNDE